MNKARKGPAFLVIFLMLLLIAAYIYAAYQTVSRREVSFAMVYSWKP